MINSADPDQLALHHWQRGEEVGGAYPGSAGPGLNFIHDKNSICGLWVLYTVLALKRYRPDLKMNQSI